jgi:hypothetical protein
MEELHAFLHGGGGGGEDNDSDSTHEQMTFVNAKRATWSPGGLGSQSWPLRFGGWVCFLVWDEGC